MQISLIRATESQQDAKTVMEWRNDPRTLEMFYDSSVNTWPAYYDIYIRKYFEELNELGPFFGFLNSQPIAFLNANLIEPNFCDIDINLSPEMRGKGLGAILIQTYTEFLHGVASVPKIMAEIKTKNVPSCRTFEKAGYKLDGEKTVVRYGKQFDIYEYVHEIGDQNA